MKYLILAIAVILSGCATYGKKIDASAVMKIEQGKTTEQEVYALLGKPMSSSIAQDGKKFLMYMHIKSQAKASSFIPVVGAFAGGADTQSDQVQIWLENGVVSQISHTMSESELNTGLLAN